MKWFNKWYVWAGLILLALLGLTGFGGLLYEPLWTLIFIIGGILIIVAVIILVWFGIM